MSVCYNLYRQNCDAEALHLVSRPPLVTEKTVDPWLEAPVYNNISNGLARGVVDVPTLGMGSEKFGDGRTDPRRAAMRLSYIQKAKEAERMDMLRATGSDALSWNGSSVFVPDQITGYFPTGVHRGPYCDTEYVLREGETLAAQTLPRTDPTVLEHIKRVDKVLCGMWGIPSRLIDWEKYGSVKDEAIGYTKILYGRAQVLADEACICLQTIINEMYEGEESEELRFAYETLKKGGLEDVKLQKAREVVNERDRYTVSYDVGTIITMQELERLLAYGLKIDEFVKVLTTMYSLPMTALDIEDVKKAAEMQKQSLLLQGEKGKPEGGSGGEHASKPPKKKAKVGKEGKPVSKEAKEKKDKEKGEKRKEKKKKQDAESAKE